MQQIGGGSVINWALELGYTHCQESNTGRVSILSLLVIENASLVNIPGVAGAVP